MSIWHVEMTFITYQVLLTLSCPNSLQAFKNTSNFSDGCFMQYQMINHSKRPNKCVDYHKLELFV